MVHVGQGWWEHDDLEVSMGEVMTVEVIQPLQDVLCDGQDDVLIHASGELHTTTHRSSIVRDPALATSG